jgi:hypothetical protein
MTVLPSKLREIEVFPTSELFSRSDAILAMLFDEHHIGQPFTGNYIPEKADKIGLTIQPIVRKELAC